MVNIEAMLAGKERLEFGNVEQIQAIRNYEEAQEEAEENLKIYLVEFSLSGSIEIEVMAEDETEAKEKARDEIDIYSFEDYDVEHLGTMLKTKGE